MPLVDLLTDDWENEQLERAQEYRDAWEIYDGDHPQTLPVTKGAGGVPDVDDNVIFNASGLAVDRSVSFLFGTLEQQLGFSLEEGAEGSPDEEWLDQVWEHNLRQSFLQKVATNGGVCGHAFVRIAAPRGLPVQALTRDDMLRLVNLDPAYVSAVWDEDDIDHLLGWVIQYPTVIDGKPGSKRQILEPTESGEQWEVTYQRAIGREGWAQEKEPEIWPFPFSPIFHCQNLPRPNEFYGRSDLDGGVSDVNMAINRALSQMQRILRHHGHPKPYAIGVTPEQIRILIQGVDRIVTLPEGANLGQLEMSGDLNAAIEFLRQLKVAFAEMAKNPQVDPEKLGAIGGLSGVALRILYWPLLEKTGQKRGTYGPMLQQLNEAMLQVVGREPQKPTIQWPDPLPVNELEQSQILVVDRENGVSQETYLEKRGYNPQLEAERRENEAAGGIGGGNLEDEAADLLDRARFG